MSTARKACILGVVGPAGGPAWGVATVKPIVRKGRQFMLGRIAQPWRLVGGIAFVLALMVGRGSVGDGSRPKVVDNTFGQVVPLNPEQVTSIVTAAARSVSNSVIDPDDPNEVRRFAIVVLDRLGNVLRLYSRGVSVRTGLPPVISINDLPDDERVPINFAMALARAAAFLSHSQAPLTSRTGEFLNAFPFPPVFLNQFDIAPPAVFPGFTVQRRLQNGINNTPQADLFQITYSNRGTFIAAPFTDPGQSLTNPPTVFNAPRDFPQDLNPDGSAPSPGLGGLPGGIPIFGLGAGVDLDEDDDGVPENPTGQFNAAGRLVGAIGCYISDDNNLPLFAIAEEAALTGARSGTDSLRHVALSLSTKEERPVPGVPREGGVFLGGVLLPAANEAPPPENDGSGDFRDVDQVLAASQTGLATMGAIDFDGYYIGPQASAAAGGLTAAEVDLIVRACDQASKETHAAIRFEGVRTDQGSLPVLNLTPDTQCRM